MGRALLLISGGMVIVFGIIQLSIVERQKITPLHTAEYYTSLQAKNVGASLIDLAIEQIRDDQSWVGSFTFPEYLGGSGFVQAYDQNSENIPDSTNVGSWNEYKVLLYTEIEYAGESIKTEVLLQRDSFSKYSYFTDYEPSNIYFFTGDELSGPVHTNGTIKIAGEPTFTGMVTSPNEWVGLGGTAGDPQNLDDNDPQFLGGSNFSAQTRTPPDNYQLEQLRGAASSGGLKYNNPINVEFNENGTVTILEKISWNNTSVNTFNIETINGVISSSEEITTKGTLKGQVTLHSEKDIRITGDLRYESDPTQGENSDDILGLVSEKNVIIDDEAHRDSGSKDLIIQASVMALGKSFKVENYSSGTPRGEIQLLGGLIQKERGPVGTFSGNSVASGFNKSYEYDERLLNMFPPSFPREKWFSVVYWRDRTN